jgi:hypothetical protein
MKDNGTIKRIDRIIMRIDLNNVLGIMKRQSGILLRIDGILGAEYSFGCIFVGSASDFFPIVTVLGFVFFVDLS